MLIVLIENIEGVLIVSPCGDNQALAKRAGIPIVFPVDEVDTWLWKAGEADLGFEYHWIENEGM